MWRPPPGARTIPVQRIRPGQHAFAAYGSEAGQWEVVSAFVRHGLARSEKVLLFLHPRVSTDEVLAGLGAGTSPLATAWDRGQVTVSSMRALIAPHREFTSARQWHRLTEEAELAVRQGYAALRAYIDMAWVDDLGTDIASVLERERSAEHLFTNRRYSEVCAYDHRAFGPEALRTLRAAHPVHLLDAPGSLRAEHGAGGGTRSIRLLGEADIATHAEFAAALRDAFARARPDGPLHVDLTALHFLGASCAADLLRQAAGAAAAASAGAGAGAGAGGPDATTVRCTPIQARTLRRLGSDAVRSLTLVEEGNGC
ncbi:hypothetical protein G5C65_30355 [Streptomyces sp. SB3404]|uniref:MEDS domain-containing protein n=1 Tax=Streptomyces boncukensis TaxID=2711219 RepID=A0A6G4X754_9ACTN|nr:hypothetical protein [Streptomyces boncukensis]